MVTGINTSQETFEIKDESYTAEWDVRKDHNNEAEDFIDLQEDLTNIVVGILKRFQTPNHVENLNLSNENLYIARQDGEKVFPLLQIRNIPAYIIIERIQENQVRAVKNISEWTRVERSSTPKKSEGSSSRYSGLDVTGSPLSCPFQNLDQMDMNLSYHETESSKAMNFPPKSYHGFPIHKARSITSNLKGLLKILKSDCVYLPPVWVVCDGKDPMKTMFLGLHVSAENDSSCLLTSSGPHMGREDVPSLERIHSHFAFGFPQPRVGKKVEGTYEVLANKDERSSSLRLCCRWSQTLKTLASPGPDAFTTAKLHLEPADERSPSRVLFLEMEILRNLISGLEDNVLKWYRAKEGKPMGQVLDELFQTLGLSTEEKQKQGKEVLTLDKIIEDKFLQTWTSMEFTDKIWNVLKGSGSLSELQEGFNKIFKKISAGDARPQIHVRNDTEFAVICRNLIRRQCQVPTMGLREPIEMLLQIGLEKVRKDYIHIFQVCDLATAEQLAHFTSWRAKTTPFSECLSKLEKLHMVMEIVVILRSTLNLSNAVLSHITSKTLMDLAKKPDLQKDFEFQVDTSSIKNIANAIVPNIWTYEMWSENEKDPNCNSWMKFAVKKNEDFFKMDSESDEGQLERGKCQQDGVQRMVMLPTFQLAATQKEILECRQVVQLLHFWESLIWCFPHLSLGNAKRGKEKNIFNLKQFLPQETSSKHY